jgi:hypothetical protein
MYVNNRHCGAKQKSPPYYGRLFIVKKDNAISLLSILLFSARVPGPVNKAT